MFTIAVIDKFPIIRRGAEIMLNQSLKDASVLTAGDLCSFQVQYPKHKPDVFVLGIDSKSIINPFILIPVIKKLFGCPVVVYDDLKTDHACLQFFCAGANGYVSKCNPLSELVDCIHTVRQNKSYASSEAFQIIVKYLPEYKGIKNIKLASRTTRTKLPVI